ncbi:MAG: YcaO-like family protein [Candidatus Roizmanbacteria bacterium]|nr:YcaO-like family protein [Candidatus Roizmanbacteria bacterium]
MELRKQVELLIEIINNITPISTIQNSNAFFDELPVHFYSGLVRIAKNNPLRTEGYEIYNKDIVAGGSSVDNKMLGVLKCAAELIERFSLFAFHPKNILIEERKNILERRTCVDPQEINPKVKSTLSGWVKGFNVENNNEVVIPAQMIYLNYFKWAHKKYQEKKCIQHISNGGCFGFTKESTLLRGIYELIERDAILTKYLAKLPLYDVNMESIHNDGVKSINKTIKQYNFENILIDATGDLGIPTYVSAAIDKSGIVPHVTFGAKTSLHEIDAVMGALEESHMGRTWVRYELLNRNGKIPYQDPNSIHTRLERAFYYADKSHSKPLFDSLLKKNFVSHKSYQKKSLDSDKIELSIVLNILKKKKLRVFAVDIKPAFLDKYPIHIYKVIMPDLQYLYLEEQGKTLNMKRIESICHHYRKPVPTELQKIPHFLL